MPPSPNSDSDPSRPDAAPPDAADGNGRGWPGRLGRLAGAGVAGLLLLIGAGLLVLQTETGATAMARFAAAYANPLSGTTITVERASGSWVRSLRLTGVTITDTTDGDTARMARVDTIAARYRLWPLLMQGRLHVTSLSAADPAVTMRQAADSSWDWTRKLPASDPADTSAAMPIQVDQVRVSDAAFTAAFYAPTRDSTARVESLHLRARDLRTAPTPTGVLDTLGLRARPPADTGMVRLSAAGRVDSATARLDTLGLRSPRSHVWGEGTVRFGAADSLVDDATLRVRAAPLALADLVPLVPFLDVHPSEAVRADLRVTGRGRRIAAEMDAAFSGGGTVAADAATTLPASAPDAPLQYRLDATVQGLTTSLLGPLDPAQNRLSATTAVDLAGPSLDALDGTASLRLTDTRWASLRTAETEFTSTVRDGTARFDLRGTLNDARLQASGRATPFADAPAASMTARTDDLDAAAFAPDLGVTSALTATTQVEARALGTDSTALDATLRFAPSRVGRMRLQDGTARFALNPDEARLDAALSTLEGRAALAGTVRLDGSERFALERLRLDRVDVAALMGDTTGSAVTGTLQAEGRGFAPASARLDATLDLPEAHYGRYRVSGLTGQARLRDGRLSTDTRTVLNGGTWTLAATARPFAPVPTAELTEGRFRDVDIGPLLGDTSQTSRLNGQFRGELTGASPDTLRFTATASLDSSRVNRQRIDAARLQATVRGGRLTAEAALNTPDGRARLAATARPFAEVPTYQVRDGTFEGLDIGALAGQPGLRTSLSGRLSLDGRGITPAALTLDGRLTLAASTVNDAALSAGRMTVGAADGRVTTEGTFSLAGGRFHLSGRADSLATTPAYALQAAAGSLDVGALAGLDTLAARVDTMRWTLDGQGRSLDGLTATTQLRAGGVRVDRFDIRTAALSGRIREGRLSLDTLGLDSNVLAARGSGALALTDTTDASTLTVEATVSDLRPLRRLVGARTLRLRSGTVEAQVYGTAANQRFNGSVEFDGLVYDDIQVADAELDVNGARGREQGLRRLEASGVLGYVSLPSASVDQTQLQAVYDGDTLDVDTNLRLDQTHAADLQAHVVPSDTQTTVTVRRLDLRLGPDRWTLAQAATLTAAPPYRVQDFLLRSGDRRIAARGVVDPSGTQDLRVDVENFQLGSISSLVGFPGLGGALTGTTHLTGPASAPQLDGQVAVKLESDNQSVGTMHLNVGYDALALRLDATLVHASGSVLTARGTLPADLRLAADATVDVGSRPVDLTATTEQFPVNWISPFLDPATVRDVQGVLTADLDVGGTLNDPVLDGTASLRRGRAYLPALGATYQRGQATVAFADDQVTVQQASVESDNGGRLRASGLVNFPRLTVGAFDLDVQASDFLAINTQAYRGAIVDGSMQVQGTTERPELTGTVAVQSANVYYTEATAASGASVATVPLTREDQLTLENRFGLRVTAADTTTFDAYEATAMDLTVQIQRNTWLRSQSTPEMNVQFTGDLDLNKAHNEEPQVFGSIEVVGERSTLRQFGQEFQITEGTLTFNGDPYTPYLDLAAVYEQRARGSQGAEVRITLALQGRPNNLSPTLSSEPTMDTRNILSYLATGRPADELFSGGSGGAGGTGSGGEGSGGVGQQLLLGQATNFVENLAASRLGLDVVRLQVRPSGTSYFTLGRYFTPRFYASIEQPVTTSNLNSFTSTSNLPDLTLEYQLTDVFLLRTLSNQNSLQLNLLFEYAY